MEALVESPALHHEVHVGPKAEDQNVHGQVKSFIPYRLVS